MSGCNQLPIQALQAILHALPDLYLIIDEDLNIVDASESYLRATNMSLPIIVGKYIFDMFPDNPTEISPTGVANLLQSLLKVKQTKKPHTMALQKYDVQSNDSFELRYWLPTNVPVLIDNQVKYIIHRVEDVTELALIKTLDCEQMALLEANRHLRFMYAKLMEREKQLVAVNKELKIHEDLLRAMLEGGNDILIMMLTKEGIISSWNKSAETILGYNQQEALGLDYSIFFPDLAQEQAWPKEILAKAKLKNHFEFEDCFIRKNNNNFMAKVIIKALVSPEHELIGYGVIMRDLTEIHRNEMIKNEFISTINHEVRTPLTSVSGAVSILQSGTVDKFKPQVKNLLDIAHKNCTKLNKIISDIITTDKIETGKLFLQFQKVNFSKLLREVIRINKAYANEFNVNIKIINNEHDLILETDKERLIQVLNNIVANAIKFSPTGETITITIKTNDSKLSVAISDNGAGVPEAFQPHIFDKFMLADTSNTRKNSGIGLGLSISKYIVEKLNGHLFYETKTNHGTTFYIELPLAHCMDKQVNANVHG